MPSNLSPKTVLNGLTNQRFVLVETNGHVTQKTRKLKLDGCCVARPAHYTCCCTTPLCMPKRTAFTINCSFPPNGHPVHPVPLLSLHPREVPVQKCGHTMRDLTKQFFFRFFSSFYESNRNNTMSRTRRCKSC